MIQLQGITEQAKQTTDIVLPDGSRATLSLEYRPQQSGWFYNLVWNDFVANGLRLVAGPNLLRGFRRQLPFGLALFSKGDVEPLNQNDFVDGVTILYLLTAAEVAEIETLFFTGP